MTGMAGVTTAAILAGGLLADVFVPATAQKVDIVRVSGCLKEDGSGGWLLTNATDPVPDSPQADTAGTPQPMAGKNEFKLIGVSEFKLPTHKDQTVLLKGLLIKAAPIGRLNITSV